MRQPLEARITLEKRDLAGPDVTRGTTAWMERSREIFPIDAIMDTGEGEVRVRADVVALDCDLVELPPRDAERVLVARIEAGDRVAVFDGRFGEPLAARRLVSPYRDGPKEYHGTRLRVVSLVSNERAARRDIALVTCSLVLLAAGIVAMGLHSGSDLASGWTAVAGPSLAWASALLPFLRRPRWSERERMDYVPA
ncbi:MAG: hypothetical protein M3Y87_31650 [Myxococcota bacterium]|nr:hypothetical protein [Myxococcota bacterium]